MSPVVWLQEYHVCPHVSLDLQDKIFGFAFFVAFALLPPKQKMSGLDLTLWSSFVRSHVYQLLATMLNGSQLHFSGTLKPIIWPLDVLIPCLPALWSLWVLTIVLPPVPSSLVDLNSHTAFLLFLNWTRNTLLSLLMWGAYDSEGCSLISVWLF